MTTEFTPFGKLFVTPVLPYLPGAERVDEDAYRNLLRMFLTKDNIDAGLGMIANPEASEIFYLAEDEKDRILEITLEEVGGRVPVLAGVGHPTTAGAAARAAAAGADGLFVMPPIGMLDVTTAWDADRYPEVFVDMLQAVARVADLPMVVHPTAAPSPGYGIGLPGGATRRIIEDVPNVVGWKMTYSYDGYRRIARLIRDSGRSIDLLGAAAKYFHENLASQELDGTVTGALNYALEPMLEHIAAWQRDDLDAARAVWDGGLDALQDYIYSEYSRLHVRYKAAAWIRGAIPTPELRAPIPQPRREEADEIRRLLDVMGLPVISRSDQDAYFR